MATEPTTVREGRAGFDNSLGEVWVSVDRRIQAIRTERPLTEHVAVVEPALLVISSLLAQFRGPPQGAVWRH
jgi:hypothetical protein